VAEANTKATNPEQSQADLLTAWLTLSNGNETGNEPVRLPVLSGSMLPMIPVGSTLIIKPCPASAVQRGDVIVFQDGHRLVAHRLLLQYNIGPLHVLFQKGDSNLNGGWISPSQVKGKVLEVEKDTNTIKVSSNQAASSSLLHLLRNFVRNLASRRR